MHTCIGQGNDVAISAKVQNGVVAPGVRAGLFGMGIAVFPDDIARDVPF